MCYVLIKDDTPTTCYHCRSAAILYQGSPNMQAISNTNATLQGTVTNKAGCVKGQQNTHMQETEIQDNTRTSK